MKARYEKDQMTNKKVSNSKTPQKLIPVADEMEHISVQDDVIVSVFGQFLPDLGESEFDLPWGAKVVKMKKWKTMETQPKSQSMNI